MRRFVTPDRVREMFAGRSDMWLWRQEHDPKSNFPRPVRINGRRYWDEDELAQYQQLLMAKKDEAA